MTPIGWTVVAACVAACVAGGVLAYRFRSRILFALRPKRKPGRRREPVEKRAKPPPGKSLEGALELREQGRADEALELLGEIDQGKGLRRLLRAAALLEAGRDPGSLGDTHAQLGGLSIDAARVRTAAGLVVAGDLDAAEAMLGRVNRGFEPATCAWVRVSIARGASRPDAERQALVELVFADDALARTVAARDLGLSDGEPASAAVERYGAHAFARDAIARFGAASVAKLLSKVAP